MLLAFIMIPLLQRELDTFKDTIWNAHRIRAQNDAVLLCGIQYSPKIMHTQELLSVSASRQLLAGRLRLDPARRKNFFAVRSLKRKNFFVVGISNRKNFFEARFSNHKDFFNLSF